MQKPLRCDHKWGIVTFQYRIGAYWNLFSAIKIKHKNFVAMDVAMSDMVSDIPCSSNAHSPGKELQCTML